MATVADPFNPETEVTPHGGAFLDWLTIKIRRFYTVSFLVESE